jgi:hypothetical protein
MYCFAPWVPSQVQDCHRDRRDGPPVTSLRVSLSAPSLSLTPRHWGRPSRRDVTGRRYSHRDGPPVAVTSTVTGGPGPYYRRRFKFKFRVARLPRRAGRGPARPVTVSRCWFHHDARCFPPKPTPTGHSSSATPGRKFSGRGWKSKLKCNRLSNMSVASMPQFLTSPSRYKPISQEGTWESTGTSDADDPEQCTRIYTNDDSKQRVRMRNFKATMQNFLHKEGIHPSSDHRRELHRLSVLASVAVIFFAPLLATFDMRNDAPKLGWAAMVVLHTIADLILTCESISDAITGYFVPNDKGDKCKLVNTIGENVSRYAQSYMILDFVTSFPVLCRGTCWR